jgi:hypothetical protein
MGEMQYLRQFALSDALVSTEEGEGKSLWRLHPTLDHGPRHEQAVEMHHPAKCVKYLGGRRIDPRQLRLGYGAELARVTRPGRRSQPLQIVFRETVFQKTDISSIGSL